MATVATFPPLSKPPVQYARLYTLEGYMVQTPTDTLFIDHDRHVYALQPEHITALTLLGAVPAIERANVLDALARCGEVC